MRLERVVGGAKRFSPGKVARYGSARVRKWFRLLGSSAARGRTTPVFVVGCNRSGTNMVCKAVGGVSYGWDYPERELSVAFNGYYLRSHRIIEWLIRSTPARVVTFGSILDSQSTDELLARFPRARALWVYRRYEDVANSCARMRWGAHLLDLVRWAAGGELERLGARGRRIHPDTVRLLGELVAPDLSVEEGACLYWYLRNRLYFDLGLYADPRVLLVQYEDAVLHGERAFRRIFRFLGLPFEPQITEGIFASSVGKDGRPDILPSIRAVCDDLQRRLDARYHDAT